MASSSPIPVKPTCQFVKLNSELCKHFVAAPETLCWQHARTWRHKLKALTRNQTILFVLAVIGLPSFAITVAGTYFSYRGWIDIHLPQLESAKPTDTVKPTEPEVSPPVKTVPTHNSKRLLASPTPAIVSSDPFAGDSNAVVAGFIIQEADSIESLGKQCVSDGVVAIQRYRNNIPPDPRHGFHGPQAIQLAFWNSYQSRHQLAIEKLHDSLFVRLGPTAVSSFDEEYQSLVSEERSSAADPTNSTWSLCMAVEPFASELRRMAARLSQ
jgi:hypothetical protein